MFLPAEFSWLEPVLIASAVVFVIDLIGNTIAFGNKVVNALVTAILFGGIFAALTFYGYGGVSMDVRSTPAYNAPATSGTAN